MNQKQTSGISRRRFLQHSAAAAALTIVNGNVPGGTDPILPGRKLNIAVIGIGGQGKSNISAICKPLSARKEEGQWPDPDSQNIAALCDTDWGYAAKIFDEYPEAKRYKDYRIMFEQMGDTIDAVLIATPDHTHACIAMEAMRRGKHVYVQKPLTHSIYEARMLTEAARKYGVITQMGNQGHSCEGIRLICEWIWDGAIGDVREVHAWTNRPVWPQGISRPADTPPVPETLDWDLWLGPAPTRPYHSAYHPKRWRSWIDFGTGALGDMACHILDPVFWSLKLKYPMSVEGSYANTYNREQQKRSLEETYPVGSMIHFQYPARGQMPAVEITWYDGGLMPKRPAELEKDRRMGDSDGGVLFVGDKGKLMCGCYGSAPQLIPYSAMKAYKRPEKTIPRVTTGHEMAWVKAIVEGRQPSANFDYAGPLTEMILIGNLSLFKPGEKILWDGENMQVTNFPELNKYVNPPYREGWHL